MLPLPQMPGVLRPSIGSGFVRAQASAHDARAEAPVGDWIFGVLAELRSGPH